VARELSVDEIRELLGAYALDAVDPDEREAVEALLVRDPRARAEVAEFRETAALLAQGGGEAPTGLWHRIEESLEEPPPPLVLPVGRPRRRVGRIAAVVGIAAAVTAFVALGAKVVDQDRRLDDVASPSVSDLADAARDDPAARTLTLASSDRSVQAEIVWLPDGTGYLVDDNLPALPDDKTYQLWAVTGDDTAASQVISAGVLGSNPRTMGFQFEGPVQSFVVTEEDAPGVVSSEQPPFLAGSVS
jgi:anti-sigma-K factor RskA